MDLFQLDTLSLFSFFLTLIRISLVLFLLPFFGGEGIPKSVKGALCLVLTLSLWPTLSFSGVLLPASPWDLLLLILGELLLGLVMGLMVRFIFAAVQTGGQVIGFQMGFSMVNAVDPDTGASEGVAAHFLYMIALLTFLSLNGHLVMLKGLAVSFKLVPPGALLVTEGLTRVVFSASAQMFVLAIKMAAPVIAAIFLVDLALALISRAAPQMNVLLIGFPLKIGVGFLFLGLLFTLLAQNMEAFVSRMLPMFNQLMRAGM
ncbi:MAG: flagellar biosynthetic protein FliR [Deltaproteobacteria bacterium]|nr:flagellar biosynthetic protein FliR [Deltaproteobacteria bacterium]